MPEAPATRRPSRAPRQQYRAVVEIVYPTDYEARKRQVAGEDVEVTWAKVAPGEPVPGQVIAESPWLVEKGRVEPIADDAPAEEGGS